MVVVRSRRALVVLPDIAGEQSRLGRAISDKLQQENVPLLLPSAGELDWQNEKELLNYFALHMPDTVICALPQGRQLYRIYSDPKQRNELETLLQHVITACWKSQSKCVLWSDYHVFGGETKSSYTDTDTPMPLDDYGEFVWRLEQQLAEQLEHYVIIRFSWLVDGESDNLFTQVLTCLSGKQEGVRFSRYRRGSPTWLDDALRVVYGVTRQVMSGSHNWGVFHYGSNDHCSEWEFAQAVADTYNDLLPAQGELLEEPDKNASTQPLEPASATLNCRRIRNNFGVHGRSWRQGLQTRVRQWLEAEGLLAPEAQEAD